MNSTSRFRSFLCFCVIALVHIVIIAGLNIKHLRTAHSEKIESTVWFIPETIPKKIIVAARPATLQGAARVVRFNRSAPAQSKPEPHPEQVAIPIAPEVHLDLDALRADAVQQEIARKKSPIELANEATLKNTSVEARVEEGVNRAQRPDCRTAHSGAGIFAPLMIAADLVRDKGCKF